MSKPFTLCGVILAAGKSSRMGTDKALLPWPPAQNPAAASDQTLLSAAILAFKAVTDAVVVVAGANTEQLAPIVAACGAALAQNPDPERGQFSSLQVGLQAARARGYDAVMITPVDCPPLSAAALKLLRASFERALAAGMWAVAPEHNGRRGHPLMVGRALIDAFLAAPASGNARDLQHTHAEKIESVVVPDSLLGVDLNTPDQYAALSGAADADSI